MKSFRETRRLLHLSARTIGGRWYWIWPIVAIVLLSVAGFYIRSSIESTIKGNLTSGLRRHPDS